MIISSAFDWFQFTVLYLLIVRLQYCVARRLVHSLTFSSNKLLHFSLLILLFSSCCFDWLKLIWYLVRFLRISAGSLFWLSNYLPSNNLFSFFINLITFGASDWIQFMNLGRFKLWIAGRLMLSNGFSSNHWFYSSFLIYSISFSTFDWFQFILCLLSLKLRSGRWLLPFWLMSSSNLLFNFSLPMSTIINFANFFDHSFLVSILCRLERYISAFLVTNIIILSYYLGILWMALRFYLGRLSFIIYMQMLSFVEWFFLIFDVGYFFLNISIMKSFNCLCWITFNLSDVLVLIIMMLPVFGKLSLQCLLGMLINEYIFIFFVLRL